MPKKIVITANGDLEGDGVKMAMATYHSIIRAELTKMFPGVKIVIDGDSNTYGGNSAYLIDDEDGEVDLHHEMEQIYITACDDPRWHKVSDDE